MRVFTTKVTSTPALRVLKKDKNGREKVVAVAEVCHLSLYAYFFMVIASTFERETN